MKVPYLTTSQIENDTRLLLTEYEQKFGGITEPPIDVEGIIESLFQLDLRFADLKSSLGADVLGAMWVVEREVRVDESLDPTVDERKEGRYRFTLGHEAGHWRLHRPLFEAKANQGNLFGEVSEPAIVCRSSSKEPQEWQADVFSGFLLMPESLVKEQWEKIIGSAEPHFAADEIEEIQTRWSLAESNTPTVGVARKLAQVFKVSGQAMQIRLIGLGLIRTRNSQSELFSRASEC
jgi:Zn-dependent peptidase ImmA (M78 family)